jgi:uncharacterized membrane protein YoaK (UPF0700 family)
VAIHHDPPGDSWGERHRRDIMLLALTWAAGSVDAISFLALGHVFTANMTGNTVLLGLHLAQEQGAAALRSLMALAGFGGGLVIGALLVERSNDEGPWPRAVTRAFALEAAILLGFAVGAHLSGAMREAWEGQVLIVLSAVAMGIQSAAVRRLDVPGISTTYVTGTLTSAVTGLVARSGSAPLRGEAGHGAPGAGLWWRRVRLQLLTLLVYGSGALIAGLVQARWPKLVAILPLVAVVGVVAAASARPDSALAARS